MPIAQLPPQLINQIAATPPAHPIFALCLMGPTAAGKTAIAIELAQQFDCDLISVDSAQVYRGMDIGTAKPTPDELQVTPHRLIDIRDPWESYSAGEFCRDAAAAIQEISAAGRVPLLVGGTMLYFHVLQQGLAELPAADAGLRAELDARAAREGWAALHKELAALDPETAARLRPTDRQRIQRALEICLLSGEAASALQKTSVPAIDADYLNIGVLPTEREVLHARIADRLSRMQKDGFLDEVRTLSELPEMHHDAPAMRAVGYRQLWRCIAGDCDELEAFDKTLVATRRLAKRQLTWLRSWRQMEVVDCETEQAADQTRALVADWLDSRATAHRNG